MREFEVGNRVRIDIPEETDPDHQRYHSMHGEIIEIYEDSIDEVTGDDRDSRIYRVILDGVETPVDFRWRDLRPPIE
jgi:ribosomal protein L21E